MYSATDVVSLHFGICFAASFFQAAANYDSIIETEGFPPSAEDIWILGSAYDLNNGKIQLTTV